MSAIGILIFVLFIGFAFAGSSLLWANNFNFAISEILFTASGAMIITSLIGYKTVIMDAPGEFRAKTRVKNLETETGLYINIEAFLDTYPTKLFALDGLPYLSSILPNAKFSSETTDAEKTKIFADLFETAFWKWFSERYKFGWLVDDDFDTGFLGEKSGTRSYNKMKDIQLENLDLQKLMIDSGSKNPWLVSETRLGFKIPRGSKASYSAEKRSLLIKGSTSSLEIKLDTGSAMLIKPIGNRSNFAEMLNDLIKSRIRGVGNLQTHQLKLRTHTVEISQNFTPWNRYSNAAKIENVWGQTIANDVENSFGWPALYKALEHAINERVIPFISERTL